MQKQVIFYGAGRYAEQNLDKWMSSGLNPLCFADADTNKHYKKCGGVEILPLSEAIKHYPNYSFYLTVAPANLHEVTLHLRDNDVPQERIKYADEFEWGLDCPSLNMIFLYGNHISFCCGNHVGKIYDYFRKPFKNFSSGLMELYEFRDELRELHKLSIKGPCEGCYFAIEGIVPANLVQKPTSITFNTGFDKDLCNLDCVYCIAKPRLAKKYGGDLFNTLTEVIEFYDKDTVPDLHFACGEFFARKEAEDMLDYLEDKNCKISVSTGASIFSKSFMKLIRKNKVNYINVSLDSGTRETYKKIKGRDFFDKVINNLENYSKAGLRIDLKYIFAPGINDNRADISGFINIAKRINIQNIIITADANISKNQLPKQTIDVMFELYDLARNSDISVDFQLYHLNPDDIFLLENLKYTGCIYLDTGNGFSEDEKISFNIRDVLSGKRFNIPEQTAFVRFDPLEGVFCCVTDLEIKSNKGMLSVNNTNGHADNGIYTFYNKDPQFMIEITGGGGIMDRTKGNYKSIEVLEFIENLN